MRGAGLKDHQQHPNGLKDGCDTRVRGQLWAGGCPCPGSSAHFGGWPRERIIFAFQPPALLFLCLWWRGALSLQESTAWENPEPWNSSFNKQVGTVKMKQQLKKGMVKFSSWKVMCKCTNPKQRPLFSVFEACPPLGFSACFSTCRIPQQWNPVGSGVRALGQQVPEWD